MTLTITITSCYEGEDSSCLVGGGGGARIPCPTHSAHGLYRPLCPSPCGAVPPALRHIPRSGWLCEYSEQEETKSTLTVFFIGIYSELILFLTNPFIYHISCESNPLNASVNVENRESNDNTTRIKVYLTKNDDVPFLVRFDLPHKGEPYVHLNIEKGEENIHHRLSPDVEDGRYDHVFDNLCKALQTFNFNGSFFYHSPSGKDCEIIRRMPEYTAMMNLASYVEGIHLGVILDDLPVGIEYMVNESTEIIRKIVKDDLEDIDSLSLPDLYCYADMIIEKELNES